MPSYARGGAGWTDENISTLKELWLTKSAAQIAAVLGPEFTRSSVISKGHRLHLPAKPAPTAAPRAKPNPVDRARQQSVRMHVNKKTSPYESVKRVPLEQDEGPIQIVDSSLGRPKPGDVARLKLDDLNEGTCKWPVGDPQQAGFGFCGDRPIEGKPYCPVHDRRAYSRVVGG